MTSSEEREVIAGTMGFLGICMLCVGSWFFSVPTICAGVFLVFACIRYGDAD